MENSKSGRSSCQSVCLFLFMQAKTCPVFATDYCPSICSCSIVQNLNLDVKCQNAGLKYISHNIPRNATYLVLKTNKIERLSPDSWQGFDRLLSLDLSENLIASINKTTFYGLPLTVRYLYVDKNKISFIAPGSFQAFPRLITLRLTFNRLTEIKSGMFDGLPFLQYLYIYRNQLSVVEESAFDNSSKLTYLSLSSNNLGIQAVKNVTRNNLRRLTKLWLHANSIDRITADLFLGMASLKVLHLGFNKISHIDENGFRGLGSLTSLRLRDNPFKKLVFNGLSSLRYIDASETPLLTIDESTFRNATQLFDCNLILSGLPDIPNNTFLPLGNLKYMHLMGLRLSEIRPGTFRGLKICVYLNINLLLLTRLTNSTFSYLENLDYLHVDYNRIDTIEPGTFRVFKALKILSLRGNKLTSINKTLFSGLRSLSILQLSYNRISSIEDDSLKDQVNLSFLDLSINHLTNINVNLFSRIISVKFLCLTHNMISRIDDRAFWNTTQLKHLLLEQNRITSISKHTFIGASALEMIMIYKNPLQYIEENAFAFNRNLTYLYLLRTSISILWAGWFSKGSNVDITVSASLSLKPILVERHIHLHGLQHLGFFCKKLSDTWSLCTPCPPGTYRGGNNTCQPCPLGGFYQDEVAHISKSPTDYYKTCPRGMYVTLDKAPGKSESDCGACPVGTNTKQLAGHRACKCLEGFYRLNRFGECTICKTGYICSNESVTLASGFYWKWKADQDKNDYITFTKALQQEKASNPESFQFTKPLPTPYRCPIPQACLGGLDSQCAQGHDGPLCAVCVDGYYNMVTGCQKCPSIPWLCGQVFLVVLAIAVLVYFLLHDKKKHGQNSRSISDVTAARIKIVIGFYQITSLILNAFSFVEWPKSFSNLIRYIKLVQLNLLQLVPFQCLSRHLKADSYTSLVSFILVNFVMAISVLIVYYVAKAKISAKRVHTFEERRAQRLSIAKLKERCSKGVFLVIFMTYPAFSSSILNMLPQTCEEICVSHGDRFPKECKSYLRGDYSTECFTPIYKRFVYLVYLLVPYPILLPVITVALLKRYCKNENKYLQEKYAWLKKGLSFLYENYSDEYWYWEAFEMVRKFVLASFLVLLDQSSRTFLCISSISTELYAVMFAYTQPIVDRFEYYLQLISVGATSINLTVGMLLKIPNNEMTSATTHKETDTIAITVLLIFVNVVVVLILFIRSACLLLEGAKTFKQRRNSQGSANNNQE